MLFKGGYCVLPTKHSILPKVFFFVSKFITYTHCFVTDSTENCWRTCSLLLPVEENRKT